MRLSRLCLSLVLGLTWILSLAGIASADPTIVTVRVEGATRTIFEGPVLTDAHPITTEASGTYPCDGTSGDFPTPAPTPISALDDAAAAGAFTWDGLFFYWYEITRIAEDSAGPPNEPASREGYWHLLINYDPWRGGISNCEERVHFGDQVLFAFHPSDAYYPYLKLTGPPVARAGRPITVTVTDGWTRKPIEGATVGPIDNGAGATTDASGQARVAFQHSGLKGVKAEQADAIRSNKLGVLVRP
jgi:hypothetical protein